MPDYTKSIIYKLCCKDPTISDIYVGSTCNFARRKCGHKGACTNSKNKDYSLPVYQFIRENGGFDNWDMIQTHQFSCANKREKDTEERNWIEKLQSTLNKHLPVLTQVERLQWQKDYRIRNKAKICQQNKEYKEKHRADILKKGIDYYNNNKERYHQKIDCS